MTDANTPTQTDAPQAQIPPAPGLPSERLNQAYEFLQRQGFTVFRSRTHVNSENTISDAFDLPADCLVVKVTSRQTDRLLDRLTEQYELYADFEGAFDYQSSEYHSTKANVNRSGVQATYVLQPLEAL